MLSEPPEEDEPEEDVEEEDVDEDASEDVEDDADSLWPLPDVPAVTELSELVPLSVR
ncbi:hypothetical protein GCM10009799_44250 [Nocardiopsis rhodophaea]|uniref:Uncharacterized protein n=1 Tax=Nocardiopsis rhodophaea TaxID=280238 RepID=A0ABP5EXW2_9ACTN